MMRWLALAVSALTLAACNKPAAASPPVNKAAPAPEPSPGSNAVPIQGLTPLTADELEPLLRVEHRFNFPDSNIRYMDHVLEFDGRGRVVDGRCDPAACEGTYRVDGNVVVMNLYDRTVTLHFYRSATGQVYADRGVDGETVAFAW